MIQHSNSCTTWFSSRRLRFVIVALCGSIIAACAPPKLFAQEQAWEFSPYKVQLWLATEPSAELGPGVRRALIQSLNERFRTLIGAPWDVEIIAPPPNIEASMLIDPSLVTVEAIDAAAPEVWKNDKLILLSIRATARELTVDAREVDCYTRFFGPSVKRTIRQPPMLDAVCYRAVVDSFRAITRLEEGAPKSAIVRIRAGGLVTGEDSPCFVGAEDVLMPIQRNNDREGNPSRIVPIEWTYLLVETPDETNPYLMTCRVWSGKPNPVTGRLTTRKKRFGLKVKPITEATTLRVMSRVVRRGDEAYPMPGLEVYAKAPEPDPPAEKETEQEETEQEEAADEPEKASTADEEGNDGTVAESQGSEGDSSVEDAGDAPSGEDESSSPPDAESANEEAVAEAESNESSKKTEPPKVQGDPAELLGRTDWNGTLKIEQDKFPLRILYLKNGAQLLARLPLVPGLDPVLTASVPDDAPRLQAEGFVKGIQGQLMDLEAQRQILKARFMKAIEEGDLDKAQELLEEIKQLQTRNDLVRALDIQQNQQVESPVKSVQARIDQLYGKTREALGSYLSPALINELTGILNDARRDAPASASTASTQ